MLVAEGRPLLENKDTTITFNKHCGQNSWLVEFKGTYDNDRLPHVELVSQKELDDTSPGVSDSAYDTMTKGFKVKTHKLAQEP